MSWTTSVTTRFVSLLGLIIFEGGTISLSRFLFYPGHGAYVAVSVEVAQRSKPDLGQWCVVPRSENWRYQICSKRLWRQYLWQAGMVQMFYPLAPHCDTWLSVFCFSRSVFRAGTCFSTLIKEFIPVITSFDIQRGLYWCNIFLPQECFWRDSSEASCACVYTQRRVCVWYQKKQNLNPTTPLTAPM